MSLASNRGAPGQRPEKTKPPFGTVRKPLERKTPLKAKRTTRPKMSADAKVQDAMLGKGRCWLTDAPGHVCTDGYTQRSHIVKQTAIEEAFPFGAICGFVWRPVLEDEPQESRGASLFRPLQEILDDTRNVVPTCPNGNRDGAEMVDALEAVGYPEGFDDFCREYRFEFNGRYWTRIPDQRPVVLDPRAA